MTTDTPSLTHSDLMRAAGIEKMAETMWAKDGYALWELTETEHARYIRRATAALAAWEAHEAEQ